MSTPLTVAVAVIIMLVVEGWPLEQLAPHVTDNPLPHRQTLLAVTV